MIGRAEDRHESAMRQERALKPVALPEAPLLCTVEETARLLNISRTTVYTQMRTGKLRSVKVGGRRLIPRHTLDKYVADLLEAF